MSCRTHKETVLQWDLPAMRNLTGDGGSEAFSVPTLTASLQIVGSSGPVVAAKWGFSIEDRSGNQTWSFQTGGATTYLGPDANVPDDEIHLGPGTYGFHWNARGYIERMEITITAQVCA